MKGQGAHKGVFITTSAFSSEAIDYASKIVLIDDVDFAQLMIKYDVGVSKVATYEIKRKDSDYFVED